MKILHINTTDIVGGAGIAAYRLHTALRNEGIESFMLVQIKKSENEFVINNINVKLVINFNLLILSFRLYSI